MTAARIARTVDEPPLDDNRELVAGGLAAMVGSLFQTLPPAGGFSQTQVNSAAGARTQLSEVVTGLLAAAVALFLGPVLSDLPQAVLAAVVIVAVSGLVDVTAFQRLWRFDRLEFLVAVATAAAALAFDLLVGVVVGIALTIYLVFRSLNHPVVVEMRRDPASGELAPARDRDLPVPGLLVLRVEGGIYTLNVRHVQEEVMRRVAAEDRDVRVLVIDAGGTSDTSVTVMDVLAETDQVLERQGVMLWVAALPEKAKQKARRMDKYDDWVTKGKIHRTVAGAVANYEQADES
jgi:MFS superfamily sulfate permease-like transporter